MNNINTGLNLLGDAPISSDSATRVSPYTPYGNLADSGAQRSLSLLDFEEASYSVTSKTVRNELNKLLEKLPPNAENKTVLKNELECFYGLFLRFLSEKSRKTKLDWDKVNSPNPEQIIPYRALGSPQASNTTANLSKLAVLKLNGGLGTGMGCVGPKSAIEVRDGMTFLDLTVRQIEILNTKNNVDVPLILMNSFNTDSETKGIIQKYSSHDVKILTFNQSKYPRISKESLLPLPDHPTASSNEFWYPPGHGDMYEALGNCGLLDQLIAEGKEYLFISNVDNLGATVDLSILEYMVENDSEFLMEVTDKTKADIKGGTIIDYEGTVRLLEIAQVPPEHVEDFKSIKKFKIFNTNNLWINLKAIKRVLEEQSLSLEIIVNQKTLENEKIIQLETAVGAAIKHFRGAKGINVLRSRFLPVKSTSDLFLITSDLYSLEHGQLITNPKKLFPNIIPIVKLGEHFKKVQHFLTRFPSPPKIIELDHLTVTGDVYFGKDCTLKGTVIIVANNGSRIDIPSGSVLDDKVVSGNLRILDH